MSRKRETRGDGDLRDDAEAALRPITPNRQTRSIRLTSPSGAYRVSSDALRLIDRSEARAARVFSSAATFAFR